MITDCFEDSPDGRSKQGIVIDYMNNCRQGNLTGTSLLALSISEACHLNGNLKRLQIKATSATMVARIRPMKIRKRNPSSQALLDIGRPPSTARWNGSSPQHTAGKRPTPYSSAVVAHAATAWLLPCPEGMLFPLRMCPLSGFTLKIERIYPISFFRPWLVTARRGRVLDGRSAWHERQGWSKLRDPQ